MNRNNYHFRLAAMLLIFFMCIMYMPNYALAGTSDNKLYSKNKDDELAYNPLFVINHLNHDYIDVDEIDMLSFYNVVTAAKGVATYNVEKQTDFAVSQDNYLAGMSYEMPVYDIDKNSKYYIAIPNVNIYNNNFEAYDLMLTYNNDYAEIIPGYHYDNYILYIPKSAIDHPTNQYEIPKGMTVAVQLNYAMGTGIDFSKKIPVQILTSTTPRYETLNCENIFDSDTFSVSSGIKGGNKEDIEVYLNGQLIPIIQESWEYDSTTGVININVLPGVVSNVNIVHNGKKKIDILSWLGTEVFADSNKKVSTTDIKYFRNSSEKIVTLKNVTNSNIFVGWRGYYSGDWKHSGTTEGQNKIKKLKGWINSVDYMYGGYTTVVGDGSSLTKNSFDYKMIAVWAITSYAIGADVGLATDAGKITRNEEVKHVVSSSGKKESKTIWEWFYTQRNRLEKNDGDTASRSANGLGGSTNFAIQYPGKVRGCDTNLISDKSRSTYGRENNDISFESDQMNTSYYYCASCNHLDDAVESDGTGSSKIYVTCLGHSTANNWAVFAFVIVRSKQNACGIYKFKLTEEETPEPEEDIILNEPKSTLIKIQKKTDDGGPVQGFQFKLTGPTYPDGKIVTTDENGEWSATTDEAGNNFMDGDYTVEEVMNDEQMRRYEQPESQTSYLDEDTCPTIEFTFDNIAKKKNLIIQKKSNDGIIAGIKFKIIGESFWGDKVEYFGTTSSDGRIILSGDSRLRPGNYIIEEIDFDAENYINKHVVSGCANPAIEFEITGAEEMDTITIEFENIHKPVLDTSARGADTGTNVMMAKKYSTIKDIVSYEYMEPGEKYTIVGRLMDWQSNAEIRDKDGKIITTKVNIKPKVASGDCEISFNGIDTSLLAGHSVVVFEKIYKDGCNLANHEEINNLAQTVHLPKIDTSLVDRRNQSHYLDAGGDIKLEDTITYSNLKPGEDYTIYGKLYDRATGRQAVDKYGKKIESSVAVMSADASGTAKVIFRFNGENLAGKTLVAGERCYIGDTLVATHINLNDESQTVYIAKETKHYKAPETGDTNMLLLYSALALAAITLVLTLHSLKK